MYSLFNIRIEILVITEQNITLLKHTVKRKHIVYTYNVLYNWLKIAKISV